MPVLSAVALVIDGATLMLVAAAVLWPGRQPVEQPGARFRSILGVMLLAVLMSTIFVLTMLPILRARRG